MPLNCWKIYKDNEYLLELRTRCIEKQNKFQETSREKATNQSETQTEAGTVRFDKLTAHMKI